MLDPKELRYPTNSDNEFLKLKGEVISGVLIYKETRNNKEEMVKYIVFESGFGLRLNGDGATIMNREDMKRKISDIRTVYETIHKRLQDVKELEMFNNV